MTVLNFVCSVCDQEYKLKSGPLKSYSIRMQDEHPDDFEVIFNQEDAENLSTFVRELHEHAVACTGNVVFKNVLIAD